MGSTLPPSTRHLIPDPIVPPASDLTWATPKPGQTGTPAADAGHGSEAVDLIELQYQGLRARLELEAVFGEGLIGP